MSMDPYFVPPVLREFQAVPSQASIFDLAVGQAAPATGSTAIYQDLPSITRALGEKEQLYPNLLRAGVDPAIVESLRQLDRQRSLRGQRPLSAPRVEKGQLIPGETLEVLQAMPTAQYPVGRSVQPAQEKSSLLDIPGNILSNAATLFRSIPKLPALAVQTVRDLPQAPRLLGEALAQGDFQKVSQVPGINLIPGAYTAGNILEGDFQEIIENPLFTALDVAPVAGAKVFRAPANMLDEAGRLIQTPSTYRTLFPRSFKLGEDIGLTKQAKALTEEPMVSAWDLVKNKARGAQGGELTRVLDEQRVKLRGTRAGARFQSSFGTQTRDLMTMMSEYQRYGMDILNPDSAAYRLNREMERITGGAFKPDEAWIKRKAQHDAQFGDTFGEQFYGSGEAWAKRRTELSKIVQEDPKQIPQLPDYERRYITDYVETSADIARPYTSRGLDDPTRPLIEVTQRYRAADGTTFDMPEIYEYKAGSRILKQRENILAAREFNDITSLVRDPRTLPVDEIIGMIENSPILSTPRTSTALRTRVIEGYAHVLRANGFDATQVLRDVRAYRANKLSADAIQSLDSVIATMPVGQVPLVLDDLIDAVWPKTGSRRIRRSQFSAIRDMTNALNGNDVKLIKAEFNRLRDLVDRGDQRAIVGPDALPEQFINLDRELVNQSLDMLRDRNRWFASNDVKRFAQMDDRVVRQMEKTLDQLEKTTVPARWTPLVGKSIQNRMEQIADELTATSRLDPEAALDVVERVKMGDYEAIQRAIDAEGFVDNMEFNTYQDLLRTVRREQVGTWRELSAQGFDPVYVHHVPLGKTSYVHSRGVNVSGKAPAWFNERSVDFSPAEGDMALALQSQAMELIVKKTEDLLNDTIVNGNTFLGWNPVAKPVSQINAEMRPLIDREMARTGDSFPVVSERLLKRTFVKWEAPKYRNYETGLASGGARGVPGRTTSAFRQEDLYVPKNVFDALEKLQEAPKAIAVWDPIANVFRTTTLLLSPRWQLYNVLGNALTITMAEGMGWVENLPDAYRAAQAVRRGEAVPALGKFGEPPAQIRTSLGQAAKEQTYFLETGRTGAGGRGAVEAAVGSETVAKVENWGKPIKSGFDYLTDISIRFNAMVDDTTRIAGYMTAYNRHLKRADAPEIAAKLRDMGVKDLDWTDTARIAAERDMRKFAYNWDSMTPFERTVARRVFPFYGFFSHMLRYAYQYTMDHPLRVAVTAAFARAEVEDWGTGMPSYLHNLLLVGQMDEQGNKKAINFKGWNPFADLSTLLTPVGWLSQANPIISTLAEQFGIDPRTGEASLYPTATYNEQTGRLELRKRNVLQSFVENVVPQSQVVFNLAGANPEFNQLAASNPSAAGRLTASALGFPVMVRDVNVPQEIAKAELARRNAARSALNEAIRTGTTGPVRAYPELSRQVEQLQTQVAQNPTAYAQYQIPVMPPGVIDLLQGAGRTVAGVGG